MLVKNWSFVGGGQAPQFSPYNWVKANNGDLIEGTGIEAQGNADPRSVFIDHYIVKCGGKFFDPSYGGGPFNGQDEWENSSLAGLARTVNVAGNVFLLGKPNDTTQRETKFTVTNP